MRYIVIDGTFRDSDGSLKGPGQTIELAADMAAHHGAAVRLDPDQGEAAAAADPADASGPSQAPALAADPSEGGHPD
jgi:hypothetical protein